MTNNKYFYIYDHRLMPTAYNHRFFVEKFARGFGYHGYKIKLIKNIKELEGKDGFIMFSTHNLLYGYDRGETSKFIKLICGGFLYLAQKISLMKIQPFAWIINIADILRDKHLNKVLQSIQNTNLISINWFGYTQEKIYKKNNTKVIYSGDHYYIDPSISSEMNTGGDRWYNFYKSHKNALPVRFSADIDPDTKSKINLGKKKYNVSYVGARSYKRDRYEYFKNDKSNRIFGTPPYISEEEKNNIYKNSKIILGFHSDANIANGNVTERVFEAMAYGAVCITDNSAASIATDNTAIVIKSLNKLKEEINDLLKNDGKYKQLQQKGIEFAYSKGLYYHRAKEFIELAKKNL